MRQANNEKQSGVNNEVQPRIFDGKGTAQGVITHREITNRTLLLACVCVIFINSNEERRKKCEYERPKLKRMQILKFGTQKWSCRIVTV